MGSRLNYKKRYDRAGYRFDNKRVSDIRQKPWWAKYSYKIFCRDNFICQSCLKVKKANELVAHHIEPCEFGGSNEMENLMTLCKDCHIKLHAELRKGTSQNEGKLRRLR